MSRLGANRARAYPPCGMNPTATSFGAIAEPARRQAGVSTLRDSNPLTSRFYTISDWSRRHGAVGQGLQTLTGFREGLKTLGYGDFVLLSRGRQSYGGAGVTAGLGVATSVAVRV